MNQALLLTHFDRISEAPDAILRLRRFILDLAVRGKLTEQDHREKRPPELCELCRGLPEGIEQLPDNWVRARINKLVNFQYGKALPSNAVQETGLVRVFGSNGVVGYSSDALTHNPAIIIGRKGSAGALNLCDGPSWTKDVAYFVVPPSFLDIKYLYFALQTLDLDQLGKGVKPGLSREDAYRLYLSVPPPEEQRRIITKVEELMALCDRLEAAQHEREAQRDKVVASSHYQLNNGANAEAMQAQVRFYLNNLPQLTTSSKQVCALRQTILDLAVRGRLTHGNDSALKQDKREVISPDSDFPAHWSIQPLIRVAASIIDCPHSTPKWTTQGKICVRTNQFRPGRLDLSGVRFVSESTYLERIQRLEPAENDILYSREGGILGVACRVPPNTQLCLGQRMMLIRPGTTIDAAFLEMVLNSPLITRIALAKTTGGAAPRINVATVKAYPIPLPLLAEQRQIVAKVNELMGLCEQLEAQLTTSRSESRRLLEAVLYYALATSGTSSKAPGPDLSVSDRPPATLRPALIM